MLAASEWVALRNRSPQWTPKGFPRGKSISRGEVCCQGLFLNQLGKPLGEASPSHRASRLSFCEIRIHHGFEGVARAALFNFAESLLERFGSIWRIKAYDQVKPCCLFLFL